MSKTSNISYFNYLFNNYTLCCQTDVVSLIHTTSSDHCCYNGNHLILDIIQCNHRFLSMSKTSNISYFNYLFNNYTLCCQTDVVRLIHTTSSDHCCYNGNHLILDIIQCNHRFLSSFYKPLIILCNLWTSPYRG